MIRRRRHTGGFVMAEALVALAIAAMTLVLLTSATWGLSMAMERRSTVEQNTPADWLAARRALMNWASGVTVIDRQDITSRFQGTANSARMYVEPSGAGRVVPFFGEVQVKTHADDDFSLVMIRHSNVSDSGGAGDQILQTEVLRTNVPIRLQYRLHIRGGDVAGNWQYQTESEDYNGLPSAIAIEVGGDRMLTIPIFATISMPCLAELGRGGLESPQCEVR